MLCFCRRAAVSAALLVLVANSALAENWPSWRGPSRNGVSSETDLPAEWSRTKNVAWRTPLPGQAGATPVVWEDRIFLTSVAGDGETLLLMGFNTDGKELWRRKVGYGNKIARAGEGNSCSPSPVTDGEHVWSFMGNGALGCYDFAGNEVWNFNVQDRYGKFKIAFGMTSTPVLYEDTLYLQLIHGDRDPATQEALVVALDKRTGREVWKRDRRSDAREECEHSYASPTLYDDGSRRFLITHGADYTIGHDLRDGRELWRCGGLNPKHDYHPTLRFVASPTAAPGLIVVPTAKNGPIVGLNPERLRGDVTENESAYHWKWDRNTPDVPCPLIHDGLVYLCRKNGDLICLDAFSGEELYRARTHREQHRASPVYADGKVFLTARDGKITVVKAGREFEMLAQNEMQEPIASTPAFADGTIYLRSFDALWAIRGE